MVLHAAGNAATPDAGSGGSGGAVVPSAAAAAEAVAAAEESARRWRIEAEVLREEVMALRGREAVCDAEVKRLLAENAALRTEAGQQTSEVDDLRRQLDDIESWEKAVRRDVDKIVEEERRKRTAECHKLQEAVSRAHLEQRRQAEEHRLVVRGLQERIVRNEAARRDELRTLHLEVAEFVSKASPVAAVDMAAAPELKPA